MAQLSRRVLEVDCEFRAARPAQGDVGVGLDDPASMLAALSERQPRDIGAVVDAAAISARCALRWGVVVVLF